MECEDNYQVEGLHKIIRIIGPHMILILHLYHGGLFLNHYVFE
jgi:hypothetical protein